MRIGVLVGVLVGFVDGGVCVTSCWVLRLECLWAFGCMMSGQVVWMEGMSLALLLGLLEGSCCKNIKFIDL